jgi:hypothetical protein
VRGAELTGISLALSYAIVGSNPLALRAIDSFRPMGLFKKVKASIIGRKLGLKVFDSVGFHPLSPISFYTYTIPQNIRVVKG